MAEISAYTGKYNQFARQLLQKYYAENKDRNLVLSPFSILMLLGIAAAATAGNTRAEILRVLSDDLDCDEITNLLCKIQAVLTEGHALSSANAVCVQHTIEDTITPDYPVFLQAQFGGQLFSTPDIISSVNNWVKANTHGLIDKVANDSMKDMLACLINATAFEGKWTKHYTRNDIEYKEFSSSDGTTKEVAMIEDSEREYVENDSFTGFVKPYKNIDYAFMPLLPKKKSAASLNIALKKLDFTELYEKDMYLGCIRIEFSFFKPRFNIDFNGWHVEGNWFGWDYSVVNQYNEVAATVSKELWKWTDTYTIDVANPSDALHAVMLVLAIDAEKCSNNS